MRTLRCIYKQQIDAATQVSVETEVIVDDEQDPREAGREAMQSIDLFIEGMAQARE